MWAVDGPFDGAYLRSLPRPQMAWISTGPRGGMRVERTPRAGAHLHVLEPAGHRDVLDRGEKLRLPAFRYRYTPAAVCPGCGGVQVRFQDARPEGGELVRVRIEACQHCGSPLG